MTWEFKEYYRRNKDKLNKSRRERYQNDPDYRDKVLKQTREMKQKKLAERGGRVERELNGKKYLVSRIGLVADRIGSTVTAIRFWELEGVLPKPIFPGAHRMYTDHQVKLIQELHDKVKSAEIASLAKAEMKIKLKKEWTKGV